MSSPAMKRCPFCAEDIRAEAIKCRFCGELLEADNPSLMVRPEPHCPQCSTTISAVAKHCGNCGATLLKACPLCGGDNSLSQPFCTHCGVEVASVLTGLQHSRAMAWRQQFHALGWGIDVPAQGRGRIDALLRQLSIPTTPDIQIEPWVFLAPCHTNRAWMISTITIKGEDFPRWGHDAYLLATRCQFAIIDTPWDFSTHIYYSDIIDVSVAKNGDCSVHVKDGRVLTFSVKVKGAGWFEYAAILAGDSVVAKTASDDAVLKNRVQMGFMSIIGAFLSEIASLGEVKSNTVTEPSPRYPLPPGSIWQAIAGI